MIGTASINFVAVLSSDLFRVPGHKILLQFDDSPLLALTELLRTPHALDFEILVRSGWWRLCISSVSNFHQNELPFAVYCSISLRL